MNQATTTCATAGCPNPAVNPAIGLDVYQDCMDDQQSQENANPFSPRGYLGRLGFVMTSIGVWVIVFIAQITMSMASAVNLVGLGVYVAFLVAAAYVLTVTAIKRARDAGMPSRSGGRVVHPIPEHRGVVRVGRKAARQPGRQGLSPSSQSIATWKQHLQRSPCHVHQFLLAVL